MNRLAWLGILGAEIVWLGGCGGAPSRDRIVPTERASAPTSSACAIDVHVHVGSPSKQKGDVQYTSERALLAAKVAGFSHVWLLANGYYAGTKEDYTREENDYLLDAEAKHPGEITAAVSVPLKAPFAVAEMERTRKRGARVLKLHSVASGLNLLQEGDAAVLDDALTKAQSLGFVILLHANMRAEDEAKTLLAIVARHSNGPIILAHALTEHHALLRAFHAPNVYIDLSAVMGWPWFISEKSTTFSPQAKVFARELVETVRAFGSDRVLFGSDMPVFSPSEARWLFDQLPFRPEERDAIVCKNAQRVMNKQ